MTINKHAVTGKASARIRAYCLTVGVVVGMLSAMESSSGSIGIVLASSTRNVSAGRSTGKYLVAIVRGGTVATILNTHSITAAHLRVAVVQWA